jgi:hypothetical protein
MQNAQPVAQPRAKAACRDPQHSSARHESADASGSRPPVRYHEDSADGRSYPAAGVCMIVPVAAALVITCAVTPAITFVVLRSKGYGRLTASLGVATGPLGPLLAIAAPSHLPTS